MHTCANCGTHKFGMAPREEMLTFNGFIHFCTKKCSNEYRRRAQQDRRKLDFARWLDEKRSTA